MATIATPFAEVETTLASDVQATLANALATVVEPSEAAGAQFAVIFDNAYLFIDMASGMESSAPAATVLEEDMPEAVQQALSVDGEDVVISIRDVDYKVVESKPDGVGVAILRLRAA